eukprot:CCRYP_016568-RA/>CCRYP_016568-RA protein AED:0.48 eAED:0.59 QI:0/0/0/1/0/0/2/0/106
MRSVDCTMGGSCHQSYWTLGSQGQGQKVEFNALTCIDTASHLVDLIRIDNKTARHIGDKFTQCWLCRYPQPMRCVHDKGGLQTNSSDCNVLQTLVHANPPQNMTQA